MYKSYSKKQFYFLLMQQIKENKLGYLEEITIEDSWEYVYKLSTKNKAVDILIYSSVDMRNGKTREKGSDCVRLVLRWNTRFGYIYKRIGKHYRLETLFSNMVKSIKSVNPFDLNGKEFTKQNIA